MYRALVAALGLLADALLLRGGHGGLLALLQSFFLNTQVDPAVLFVALCLQQVPLVAANLFADALLVPVVKMSDQYSCE